MPDARFFHIANPISAREIIALVNGVICQPCTGKPRISRTDIDLDKRMIGGVAGITEENIENACIYIAHHKFLDGVMGGHPVGLSLVQKGMLHDDILAKLLPRGLVVEVEDAQIAFIQVANKLYREKEIEAEGGFTQAEKMHPGSATVHPTALIAKDASIGVGSKIGAYSIIGPGVSIGKNCTIESHVTLTHTLMGDGVHIFTGARIGQAGFGFVANQARLLRIPQLGGVIIGDHVEVGANSTIDRATLGNTIIGTGTCIDNQVQIAHNVEIGENCVFAAQVGISGSCKIGHNVMFGGKVGVADHITIGSGVRMAGHASTMHNIPDNETWAGTPAQPIRQFMREVVMLRKLASNKKKEKK